MYQFDMKAASCGDVAQLGECGVRNAEVRGSIPLISTKLKKTIKNGYKTADLSFIQLNQTATM